jgi:hypothetical protein
VLRAILTILTWASAAIGAAVLAAWALGRVVTDSWGWSQFVWWLPSPAAVALAAMELALAWGFAAWACRAEPRAPGLVSESPGSTPASSTKGRSPARRTRAALWMAWTGVTLYMLLGEWHGLRYIAPVRPATDQKTVRVLFWNAEVERLPNFEKRVIEQEPDLAVIANAPRSADWQAVRTAMGKTSTLRTARFSVVSKLPVRRWGWMDLRIAGVRPRVWVGENWGNISVDTGQAMFFELDAGGPGGPAVVWVLDLPSDPTLLRRAMLKEAADEIAAFAGPVMVRGDDGLDRQQPQSAPGFPTPDLVLGDCNTPRGSWSLKMIAGGMTAAFDQAGRGFAATWPRQLPVIAIDQAFVSARLRAVGYRVVDMGAALHRAEVVELAGAAAK